MQRLWLAFVLAVAVVGAGCCCCEPSPSPPPYYCRPYASSCARLAIPVVHRRMRRRRAQQVVSPGPAPLLSPSVTVPVTPAYPPPR